MTKRQDLAQWAIALGAGAGAQYLLCILDYSMGGRDRPFPPWEIL